MPVADGVSATPDGATVVTDPQPPTSLVSIGQVNADLREVDPFSEALPVLHDLDPDYADRMLKMVEVEQKHRHKIETADQKADARQVETDQSNAFRLGVVHNAATAVITLVLLVGGFWVAAVESAWEAIGMVTFSVVLLLGTYGICFPIAVRVSVAYGNRLAARIDPPADDAPPE